MPERGQRDQAGGWRHPGWSWTVRRGRLIPAARWAFGLLFAFALGNVPSLVTGDWTSGRTWVSLWLSVSAAVVAFAALGFAEVARRGRDAMIGQNGTAYIIQEQARFWSDDNAARFREGIRRQFARVIQVPGPVEAGRGWDWPLDGDTRQWDVRADELVRAFRVLRIDETRAGTPGPAGVFLWAYWAVAVAFGMRISAADRSLALDVWQRPRRAGAGEVDPAIWSQRPHRFTSPAVPGAPRPEFTEHTWPVELDVSRLAGHYSATMPRADKDRKVSVLLLRFSASAWGPLPPVADPPPAGPLTVALRAAAPLVAPGVSSAELHELRCVPPPSPSGGQFPWEQFPALAAGAATWIEGKAKELDGHNLLLAALLPQEAGLGLGLLAGQESRRAAWPARLRPIILEPASRALVIPGLELGTAALDPARHGGG
ncbi:MAG: hypothetical protein ACRDOI_40635 [Trebonia sp.]